MDSNTLIICKNAYHKEAVQKAFPEDMCVAPLSPLLGHGFKRIIIFEPEFNKSDCLRQMWEAWIREVVPLKLRPDNNGIHYV